MPNNFPGATLPLHRGSMPSFPTHEELSQTEPVIDSDQSLIDEPPPPYTNDAQVIYPLGTVLPADHFLDVDPNTPSPLAPVPQRHSSLYQVLKHETPASPLPGTLQSRVSSLAHALEPQDPQARQAPRPYTPAFRDRLGSYGISANATQMSSMSLTLAGDPRSTLLEGRVPAPAQTQALVSSETPLTAGVNAPSQNLSVVTPLQAHTLAHSYPEVPNHDYDTLPRLRKVSL